VTAYARRVQAALRLRDVRELFEQPARTPLDDDYEPWCVGPGAEYLAQVARTEPGEQIILELPGPLPGADQVQAALARYTRARADELTREIQAEVRHALRMLVPTGIVFALTLALSRLASAASSDWLSTTIAEALVVIGWVVLWSPVAILGTDIWALRRRRRAYERLGTNELELRSPS
jgi:hypothetical protein